MYLSRSEKRLLCVASTIACLIGGVAGYLDYFLKVERLTHGGILEEDKYAAIWSTILAVTSSFSVAFFITVLLTGFIPIGIWRLMRKCRKQ